jgi:RHS repeat-associated protein
MMLADEETVPMEPARTMPRVKGNCDGLVNSFDVDPFIMALTNPSGYAATYPDCMIELGDLNGDGLVNTGDLNLFTDVLGDNLLAARRYVYDEENRLTAVTDIDGNSLLQIEYDALGRRIASTEFGVAFDPCTGDPGPVDVQTRHIYSGLNTVAEYISCDAGENWDLGREFLWGDRPALDGPLAASQGFPEPLVLIDHTDAGSVPAETDEVLHYVRDALGSVVGLADAGDGETDPKLVERYDYDPYGKTYIDVWDGGSETWVRTTASAYGNPFAWTGQRYDSGVGMYHFPFRSYSPELGRWMQRDPLEYVDGVNLSEYVASQPLSWCDPLGLGPMSTRGLTLTAGVLEQVNRFNYNLQRAEEAAKSGLAGEAEYLLAMARRELETLITAGMDARTQEILTTRAQQAFTGAQRAIEMLRGLDTSLLARTSAQVQDILNKIFNQIRDHLSDPDIKAAIDNLKGKVQDGHLGEVLQALRDISSRINELNLILQRLLRMKDPPTDQIEAVRQLIAAAQAARDKVVEIIRRADPCFVY